MGQRLFLLVFSLAFSAALCEVVLRVAWTNPFRHELPERVTPLRMNHGLRELPINRYNLDPNSPITPMRTDARGYILPSRRFDKPDRTIVFLGGSTTECLALDEDVRFPALVSKLLESHGLRVDTLNAGVSGNTTHDALAILLNHASQDHPDIAVLMEAANDVGVLNAFGTYDSRAAQPLTAGSVGRWSLQALSAKSYLVGALRSYLTTGRAVWVSDPNAAAAGGEEKPLVPTGEYVKRVRGFVRLSRAFGIEPVLMTQPSALWRTPNTPRWVMSRNQKAFNEEVRRIAAQEGAPLIDLERYVPEHVPDWEAPMKVFYDGLHVTALGSRVYAEYITQRLLETTLSGVTSSGTAPQHK